MKKLIFCLLCILLSKNLSAQEVMIYNYQDKFTTRSGNPIIKQCLPKVNRLNSSLGGSINTIFASDISEEMKQCINVAAQLWEEKLAISKPIVLEFVKKKMGKDAPNFEALVRYTTVNATNAYPLSLAFNLGYVDDRKEHSLDATITINADLDWDMGFDNESKGRPNLTTAMMRSIAISLGFGSSVHRNSAKGIVFQTRNSYSPFDKLIVNSQNKLLSSVPNTGRETTELVNYVTGNNVYCKYPNNKSYKLYAPSTFQESFTLNYFDSEGDLMSYNLGTGDKMLQIDEHTLEAVRQIGWKVQTDQLKITGIGIDATGMASAYKSYQFRAEATSGASITSYSWKYELQKANQEYETVNTSRSSQFMINAISDESKYYRNADGDIPGVITLEATVNGKVLKKAFYLSLEVKPFIVSLKINKITPQTANKYFYDLDVSVVYSGTDYLYVTLEQENSMSVRTDYIREPYVAHLHFDGIEKEGRAWVMIELRNKYGSVSETLTIPDQTNPLTIFRPIGGDWQLKPIDSNKYEYIYVTDLQGKLIMQTTDYKLIQTLPKGMYVVNSKAAGAPAETEKITLP